MSEEYLRAANTRAMRIAAAAGLGGADLIGPEEMVTALIEQRDEALADGATDHAGDVCRLMDSLGFPAVPDAHTSIEQVNRRLVLFAKERDAILAFLRSDEPHRLWNLETRGRSKLAVAADAIERGAHRPATNPTLPLFGDGK